MRVYPSLASAQVEKQVVFGDDSTKQVCPELGLQYIEFGRLEVVDHHHSNRRGPNPRRKQGAVICGLRQRTFNLVCLVCTLLFIGIGVASGAGAAITRDSKSNLSKTSDVKTTSQQTTAAISSSSSLSTAFSMTSTSSSASTISSLTSITPYSTASSLSATVTRSSTPSSPTSAAYNCPSDTDTTYNPPNTTLVFRKACDTNWRKGDAGIKGGLVAEIGNFLAYTIDECIDTCVNLPTGGCTAVCYWGNITLALSQGFEGNCWLKNQRAVQSWTPDWQQEGAYLVQG